MSLSDNPEELSANSVAATDEILQVMYWLRGENIAPDVAPQELARWVAVEPAKIEALLERLVESKLLEYVPDRALRFRLTSSGAAEGGRRFADEFSDLTKPGHYECSDPNCDCRRSGNPADCVHQH